MSKVNNHSDFFSKNFLNIQQKGWFSFSFLQPYIKEIYNCSSFPLLLAFLFHLPVIDFFIFRRHFCPTASEVAN